MDGTQLGKRLKEARLAKKMTQSDVVGTFITRNMLSQIESGAAFPSLHTLEYLANALEIPVHCLLPDDASVLPENDTVSSPDIFVKCKKAYLKGDYTLVTENADALCDESGFYYDEGCALVARAHLCMARTFRDGNRPKSAVASARRAAEFSGKGIYASREVRTEALLMLDEISEKV